jgi:hypothetical protein
MTSARPRLSRVLVAAALASGLCVPAAAAPFLKIKDIDGESKDDRHKEEIEILSWSWGASQAGGGAASIDDLKASSVKPQAGEWIADVERPGAAAPASSRTVDADEKITIHANRTEAKRTPPTVTLKRGMARMALAVPLPSGSVRVKVRFPWLGCRVGATYPELELGDGASSYTLRDAVVTSCGSAAGGRPTEEVAFNYARIDF